MKKVITLTHGELGKGFLSAYEVIACEKDAFTAISMDAQDSPKTVTEKIKIELNKCTAEDTIIFLTDIAAGSTTKSVIPFLESYSNLYIITGLNLGMLLEVLMMRIPMDEDISQCLQNIVSQGRESLILVNHQINFKNPIKTSEGAVL